MFGLFTTPLTPTSSAQGRETERTEGRFMLRRKDPDGRRGKLPHFSIRDHEDEGTYVSIASLQMFIEHFLNEHDQADNSKAREDIGPGDRYVDTAQTSVFHGVNNAATQAYQRASQTAKQSFHGFTRRVPARDLEIAREVQILLLSLAAHGMEHLFISRGEAFLDSLLHAAQAAKHALEQSQSLT
ncbi:MAG: hypothetical protein L6Q57_02990 [Alphaproteobacteria bacterium]|nr:hypothetical protein [Alphaproteobacteria bacterium]